MEMDDNITITHNEITVTGAIQSPQNAKKCRR